MFPRLSTNENGNSTNDDSSASSAAGSSAPINIEPPDGLFSQRAMKRMHDLFASQQLCDVVLKCGDVRIPAHRVVLAAASDFFDRMFNGSLMESNQREVDVNGIEEPAVLRELVSYCYTGQIRMEKSTAQAILSGACFLRLEDVIDRGSQFIRSQLDASNCLGIRSFAESQGCASLQQAAHAFALEHFMEVARQPEFLSLPIEDVVVLLSSDDVNVASESNVYEAACAWLKHDLDNRRQCASRLLSVVRLPCLSPEYLSDLVDSNPLFREDIECQRLLKEAMKFHSMPDRRATMNLGNRVQPRISTAGTLYVIGGHNSALKGILSIERYDSFNNEWNDVGRMPDHRVGFGVAVLEGKLHRVGGQYDLKTLNNFDCWAPGTNSWTKLTPMNSPRNGLGVVVLEGVIYALGGLDGSSCLCTVERYDPSTKTWSYVREMSQARSFGGVAVLNGRIYAIGGRHNDQYLQTVECYSPHTNKWTHCAQMTKRRGYVGVGVLHGFVYAAGGVETFRNEKELCCVERYDPKVDTWTLIANLRIGRFGVGLCPLGNLLYAVGGFSMSAYLHSVECYDPIKNEWRKVGSLKSGRSRAGVAVIPRHAQQHIESINGNN